MSTQRNKIITSKPATVKRVLAGILIAASFGTSTISSASVLTEKGEVVSVSFSASAAQTDAGMKEVYALLETTAANACKNEEKRRYSAYNSVEDCVTDLMDQLVEDCDMDSLTHLHNAPKTRIFVQN